MLNKGAFAFKTVRGALKWPLKGGSRLIEVDAKAGLTVHSISKASKGVIMEKRVKRLCHTSKKSTSGVHLAHSSYPLLLTLF